jgi:hypothetical protein
LRRHQPPPPIRRQRRARGRFATTFEKDVGGTIVYSDTARQIALIEGYSTLHGRPVYGAIKGTQRTTVDIEAYTGTGFTAEEKADLIAAKKRAMDVDAALAAENPNGPFKDGARFASSPNTPEWASEAARYWLGLLGLDRRVYLTTTADAKGAELFGPYAAIRSAAVDANEKGSTRQLPNGDFYIAFDITGPRTSAKLEALAHEIGHILEKTAFDSAPTETKNAIIKDYNAWIEKAKNTKAKDWPAELRAHTTGKLTNINARDEAMVADLPAYWHSFSEYFADQVSRWATTTDKPLSVVDHFFKRIAQAIRKLMRAVTGKRFGTAPAMQRYLDALAKKALPYGATKGAETGGAETAPRRRQDAYDILAGVIDGKISASSGAATNAVDRLNLALGSSKAGSELARKLNAADFGATGAKAKANRALLDQVSAFIDSKDEPRFSLAPANRPMPKTIDVDGVERPTTNSDGKPIHPTEEGVRNFWRWFGESKVVDDQGKPLVVYHGTRGDFSVFDAGRQGQSDFGASGRGFYFSQDPNTANVYAALSPGDGAPNIMPVSVSLKIPYELGARLPQNEAESRLLTERVKAEGYDGIIVRGADGVLDEIVAFNDTQIKSAIGNNGDFSPTNPDIRFKTADQRPTGDRLSVDFLQARLNAVTRHWPGLAQMPVKVVGSERGLPESVRAKLREMRANGTEAIPRAVYVPGDGLYFVAPNIASTKEALLALAEEAIGHHGLRSVMGPQFEALLDRVIDERRADVEAMAADYGLDMANLEQAREAADEFLAHQARLDTRETWFQGIVQAIRQMLRKMGVRLRLSDGDIRALLAASNRYVTQGDARGALKARGRFGGKTTTRNQDARFSATGLDVNRQNIGYHYGDLGYAKDTVAGRMSGSRGTGHFGTGVYFTGSPQTTNNSRIDRSEQAVDLSEFNLATPKNKEQADRLHDALRSVNQLMGRYEPWWEEDGEWEFGDNQKTLQSAAKNIKQSLNLEQSQESVEEVIKKSVEESAPDYNSRATMNAYTDSASTRAMKALGFDGVDVRHIPEFDTFEYGTVVYREKLEATANAGLDPVGAGAGGQVRGAGVSAVSARQQAIPLFPIQESERARRQRENAELTEILTVDAQALMRAFERINGEDLVHKQLRYDNIAERIDSGEAIDSYPVVGAQYGFSIDDGRHRVAVAADRGMRIQIATNKASVARIRELTEGPDAGIDAESASNPLDADYFAAIERGDMETAKRMVVEAALESGALVLSDDSGNVGYKVRRSPPPKKTITVYKAFRMRTGGSYPMFVGAKDDIPIGIWLDATEGGYHFKSTNGIEYVPADTGDSIEIPDQAVRDDLIAHGYLPQGSKAKSVKAVAYRPGWHGGELPFFPQAGNKVWHKGKKLIPEAPDDYAYPNVHEFDTFMAEVEMDADYNYLQEYLDTAARNKDGSINHKMSGLRHIPKGGFYEYATNPLFKDRPDLGKWYISGSVRINKVLTQDEVNRRLDEANVPRQLWNKRVDVQGRGKNKTITEGQFDVLDLDGLGYDPQFNHVHHKLLDPVTYDDNGQVIPLSQRFDRTKADVRFSLADIDTHQRTLKEELTRRLKALGDTTSTAERTMMKALGSLTVRMLADVSQKVLPSAKRFVQAMSAYQTERNKMVDQATRTAHDMLKHPGKENRRLMALMNDSTVDGIDASLSAFVPKVADVTQGRMQIRALRNQAARIKRQLQGDVTGLDVAALMQERESALKRARQIGADIRSDTKLAPKHKALHARFKALPEWAQVMYTKVRDDYQGMSERMEKAIMDTALGAQLDAERKILEQIEASGLEDDAKETLRKAVHDGLYALDANNDQLAVSVKPEARKAIQDAGLETQARTVMLGHLARGLTNKQAMIARVRSEFEAGRVEGVYFPLQRFGRFYAVFERQANDEDGQPKVDTNGEPVMVKGFSMFESEYQMKLETPDIVAEGWTLKEQGYKVEAMKDLDGASEGFVADVVSKLVDEGEANAADHVYQMYLASLPFLSARKHFIHRKKTAGYTNDLPRTYATNMAHLANQIARMEATPAFKGALNGMRQESKVGEDHARAEQYLDEFQQRYEWIMNPGGSKLSSQITALGFLWHLGVSPAAALVNLTQTAMVSFPEYAAKYGFRKSGAALTRSMLEVLKMRTKGFKGRRDYDTWGSLTEDERAAFRHWHDIGAIDVTNVHSLMGLAEGDSSNYSPRVAKVMEWTGFLFQEAEVINREATLLAGYRLAREAGQSVEQARESAAEATWNSHGDYSSANRARWVQGNTARVLFQFKQYSQIITYYLARNAWNALKGADAQTRTEARKRMAGVIGMTGLLAGSQGLPYAMTAPMFMMANIVNALFGDDDDEDWDAETAWRAWLADMGLAGVAIDRGAVNALTGVDLANRVKLSDLWLRDQDDQLEGKNLYRSYLEMLAGPVVGGVGSSVFEAYRLAEEGHYQRAAEKATPKFIKDVLTAARFGMEGGANNIKGDPITDLTPFEVFMKASGFNADRLSAMYEMNSQAKTLEQRILQRRTTLIAAYGMAALNGDAEGVRLAKQKIAAYNAKKPALPIDQKSLRSSLKARERYRETSDSGIYLNPKLGYVRELTRVPL